MYSTWRANNKYDFSKVREHLKRLPDTLGRLKFLFEIKAEFEHWRPTLVMLPNNYLCDEIRSKGFIKSCELEIQKLERLLALEQSVARTEIETIKSNPEFTTARQVLAVHYLLQYAKTKNVNKTEIARFIEFLTGKNYDSIYKRVRDPAKSRKETLGSSRELEKDMDYVKSRFERLGLTEIVRMIENEKDWLRNDDEDEDFEG